ncbi:kinase-like protein [Auriscalpium vulgare]|uniref:Kinase-like protein n=1 Tax=Auriscalpium vulgare TaxID=40419 RepID=A0ACB8S2J1_9AGAM|nr:kinase-like protein [Auriscalpium vulgare]
MTVDEVAASPLFQHAFYTDEHVWHEPAAPTHEVGQPSRIQWRLPALVPPAVAAPMPSILDGLFAPPLGPEFTPDLQAAATPRQFAYLPAEDEPTGPGLAMLPVAKAQSPRVMISSSGPPELLHTQRQAGQFGPIAPPRSPGVHQDTNRQPPQAQHDLLFAKDAALRASFPRSDCQWSLHPPPGISQPYIAGGGRAHLIHTDVNAPAAFRVGPALITLSHYRGMLGSAGSGYEAELLLNGQSFPVEVNIYWKAALRADKFMLEQVLRERRAQEILRTRGSKLITRLVSSFETSDFVCFVTDTRELGTVRVRKIAAELLFGLEQLHSLGIVHRNIGANSLVFRHDGQLAIRRLFRACQQKDQVPGCLSTAPEMLADGSVHTYQADVWDYGVLLAKLCLHGKDVFAGHKTKNDLGEILRGWNVKEDPRFQERVPHVLCDLLSELLKTDPQERITLANAKKHLFFRQIDWQDISNCAGPVPEMLTLRPRPWTACPVRVGSLLKGMSLRELVYDPAVAEPDWSEFNWSAWEQWPRL